jgi:hypothetical protein
VRPDPAVLPDLIRRAAIRAEWAHSVESRYQALGRGWLRGVVAGSSAVLFGVVGLRSIVSMPMPWQAARSVEVVPQASPSLWSVPQDSLERPSLACGTATATSFHDPDTASGVRTSYETIASPFWPLGTIVKLTHQGRSTIGIVQDFGPEEWAVARHPLPAIIDISTDMMNDLTGAPDNAVPVRFQVIEWGDGKHYRSSGTGRDLAYSCT